jgi:hypothetical protein
MSEKDHSEMDENDPENQAGKGADVVEKKEKKRFRVRATTAARGLAKRASGWQQKPEGWLQEAVAQQEPKTQQEPEGWPQEPEAQQEPDGWPREQVVGNRSQRVGYKRQWHNRSH